MLNQKIKVLETELSNRNLEISRFRYQNDQSSSKSLTNTTALSSPHNNKELSKLSTLLEAKNNELHRTKRTIEQKQLMIKELEQKVQKVELQLNDKIFEANNLKRELYEIHSCKAEIDNLNHVIKKKNQEINELRLLSIEKEQMKVTIDGLERQKIRINEYLKEKDREIGNKNNKISQLEKKLTSATLEASFNPNSPNFNSSGPSHSSSLSINYENLLKHKESTLQKLQYELELQEVSLQTSSKSYE